MRLISLTIFILLCIPSYADSTITPTSGSNWEMYVLGGASVFFDIFTGLKMFTESSTFSTLALFVASLGFLVLMIKNTAQIDSKSIAIFFIAVYAASYMTFSAKVNLTVIDSVGLNRGAVDSTRVVTDVPASVGLPAAWISEIGESFLKAIEFYFSIPSGDYENLKFQNTRTLNMEAQLIKDALTIHPYPPTLTKSLGNFYTDCVFPILANGFVSLDSMIRSPNLSSLLESMLNPALSTIRYTVEEPDGALVNCSVAWTDSSTYTDSDNDTVQKGYKHQIEHYTNNVISSTYTFNKNMRSTDTLASQTASFGGLVNAILSNVAHASDTSSASDIVKNRALTRAFNTGILSSGASSGMNSESLPGFLIEEQTLAQQTEGWRVAIIAFNSMAGYIYVVLHAFIIAISPLILVLLFMPGIASKMILNYLQVLFWLTLWQPMMALVNFIIRSFQNNELAALYRKSSSDFIAAGSPEMWNPTSEILDKYTLAAGFLGTMVPMVSWGLVKGGLAFTQFISSGIGTSVAQGAAKNLATGSLSMDSVSFNNRSGNSFKTVDQIATGQVPAMHSYIANGGAAQTEGQHGDRSFVKGKENEAIQFSAVNQQAQQTMFEAGQSLDFKQTMTGQKVWNQLTSKLDTAADSWGIAKQNGKTESSLFESGEVKAVMQSVSEIFGADTAKNLKNAYSQKVQGNGALAFYQSLNDESNSNESFNEKLTSGELSEKEIYDAAEKRWEKEGDNGAMHKAAAALNQTKEQYLNDAAATSASIQSVDLSNTKAVRNLAFQNGFASGVSGMLQEAAKASQLYAGLAGAIEAITPRSDVSTSDVLSFEQGVGLKQVNQSSDQATQNRQYGERSSINEQWMNNYINSDLYTENHSSGNTQGNSINETVSDTLSSTKSYKSSVSNLRNLTAGFTDTQNLTPSQHAEITEAIGRVARPDTNITETPPSPTELSQPSTPEGFFDKEKVDQLNKIDTPNVDKNATSKTKGAVEDKKSSNQPKVSQAVDSENDVLATVEGTSAYVEDKTREKNLNAIVTNAFTHSGMAEYQNSNFAALQKSVASEQGRDFIKNLEDSNDSRAMQATAYMNTIDNNGESRVATIDKPYNENDFNAVMVQFDRVEGETLKDAVAASYVFEHNSDDGSKDLYMKNENGHFQKVERDENGGYSPIKPGDGNIIEFTDNGDTKTLYEWGKNEKGETLYQDQNTKNLHAISDKDAERLDDDKIWKKEAIEERELDNQRRTQELNQAKAMVPALDSLAELGTPEAEKSLSKLASEMASRTEGDRATLREWADNNVNSNPSMADAAYSALNVESPGQMSSASIEDKLTNLEGAKTARDFVPIAEELANGTDSDREALQEWIDNEGRNHQFRDIAQYSINYYHKQNGGDNV